MIAGANQNNLDFALANGAQEEKSTLFRYGNLIDKGHFILPNNRVTHVCQTSRELFTPDTKVIAFVGRLQLEKHPEDVITAFEILSNHIPNLKLLMIGDGDLRVELLNRIKQMGLQDKIWLVGNKPQDWIVAILPKVHVVLSPHTGRALLECALAQVGVVAYDIDWQREIIVNNQTGFLVKYRDVKAMADAAKEFLENDFKRQELALRLRTDAENLMSPKKLDTHERAVYSALLKANLT
jgi:glycosyltransferase involved in cell wall biosynthesis